MHVIVELPEDPVELPEDPLELPEDPLELPDDPVELPEDPVELPDDPVELPEDPDDAVPELAWPDEPLCEPLPVEPLDVPEVDTAPPDPAPDPEAELPVDPGFPERMSVEPLVPDPAFDPLDPLDPAPVEPMPEPPPGEPVFPESPHANTRMKPAPRAATETTFLFMRSGLRYAKISPRGRRAVASRENQWMCWTETRTTLRVDRTNPVEAETLERSKKGKMLT